MMRRTMVQLSLYYWWSMIELAFSNRKEVLKLDRLRSTTTFLLYIYYSKLVERQKLVIKNNDKT